MDDDRLWTCGKGVYAEPVAEMALTLALAGMRGLGTVRPGRPVGAAAGHATCSARGVTILGGGGITESLLRLLQPFDCHVTVVRNRAQDDGRRRRRRSRPTAYATRLPGADLVVLALPLTPGHRGDHQRRRAGADGAATRGW